MQLDITTIIVIITTIVSISGFSRQQTIDDLIFYPPAVQRGQVFRFIGHGFIHADVFHLVFNMVALYSFGQVAEQAFTISCVFGSMGKVVYLLLYLSALVVASLPDYFKYKDSYHFKSLGASGAVSAVILATVIFFPKAPMGLLFLPIEIPGYLFAIIYIGVSVYLDRKGGGNINHGAHFWGAAYGVVFTIVCCLLFANAFDVYLNFTEQMKSSSAFSPLICDF
ncbi:MAG TPA: rhomboid family intramembrane serine protease [Flavisolibacter sp.]|nr:rhomboid family intramembrane serine protease [Flavisolibacter sp.]